MTTEFGVTLEDRPGSLAELCEALGRARVNIEALHAVVHEGRGTVQFVTLHTDTARETLEAGGFDYTTRKVLIVQLLHEPGALGDVARVMAEADINIDSVYVTVGGHVVLGVDDLSGAMQVASGMAVNI